MLDALLIVSNHSLDAAWLSWVPWHAMHMFVMLYMSASYDECNLWTHRYNRDRMLMHVQGWFQMTCSENRGDATGKKRLSGDMSWSSWRKLTGNIESRCCSCCFPLHELADRCLNVACFLFGLGLYLLKLVSSCLASCS